MNMTPPPPVPAPYDREYVLMFQYYMWSIGGNTLAALGLVGNILSIFVLSNWRMKSPTSCYLIALAAFDIIVLISMVLFLALPTIYTATGYLKAYFDFYPYMHIYAYPTALIAQTCSIYTTVAFTVERYLAVCRPLLAQKHCTISRARKSVIIIVLCSIIYNVPRMFEDTLIFSFDPYTNKTKAQIQKTKFGNSSTYRHVYFIYMQLIVMLLVPTILLVVLNTLLIRAVKKSQKTQGRVCSSHNGASRTRRDNNLTIMLISVIFVFIICQVPSIADNICYATIENSNTFIKLTTISNLMVITNSAANFYLYCLFGKKFRRVFCKIFCRCYLLLTNQDPDESSFAHVSTMRSTVKGSRRIQTSMPRQKYSGMVLMKDDATGNRASNVGPGNANGSAKYTKMKDQTQL